MTILNSNDNFPPEKSKPSKKEKRVGDRQINMAFQSRC